MSYGHGHWAWVDVDVHKVANWRLPGAITCAWASEELGSGLQGCEGKVRQGEDKVDGNGNGKGWDGMGRECQHATRRLRLNKSKTS